MLRLKRQRTVAVAERRGTRYCLVQTALRGHPLLASFRTSQGSTQSEAAAGSWQVMFFLYNKRGVEGCLGVCAFATKTFLMFHVPTAV